MVICTSRDLLITWRYTFSALELIYEKNAFYSNVTLYTALYLMPFTLLGNACFILTILSASELLLSHNFVWKL